MKTMARRSLKGDVVLEYLHKFPDVPNRTMAAMLVRDNPSLFKNLDNARDVVRYYTGQNGKRQRDSLGDRTFERGPKPVNPFEALPDGIKELGDATAFDITSERSLCLFDVHIPYHDKRALMCALEEGKKENCDTIIIGGDWLDFYSLSRFEKDPRMRDFAGELQTHYDVMDVIRSEFKDVSIVFLIGNHEERFDRYMKVKAPELLGFKYLSFETCLDAEKYGMTVVSDKRIISIGSLNLIHGHEINISRGVVPARSLYLKSKQKAIMGHLHTTSDYSTKKIGGKVVSCWSVGCLCDMHPRYAPYNEWNHGFAIIERYDDVNFRVHNHKIINGRVY